MVFHTHASEVGAIGPASGLSRSCRSYLSSELLPDIQIAPVFKHILVHYNKSRAYGNSSMQRLTAMAGSVYIYYYTFENIVVN